MGIIQAAHIFMTLTSKILLLILDNCSTVVEGVGGGGEVKVCGNKKLSFDNVQSVFS